MTVQVVRFTVRGQESPPICPTCEYTVVYDGACRVCIRIAKVLGNWDRDHLLDIVPQQAPGVMARFPWIPSSAFAEALQLIRFDGATWSGAAAIEKLLEVLPKGRLVSWLFKIPLVRVLAEKFYRWFARNRHRLGCGEHCATRLPDVSFED